VSRVPRAHADHRFQEARLGIRITWPPAENPPCTQSQGEDAFFPNDTDSGLLQLSGGLTLPLALKKPVVQSRLPPHHIKKRYFPV